MDPSHNSHGRPCDKAFESSTEPNPGKCVASGEPYFLFAERMPVIPHYASLLTLSQILAKRHCYNKQLHTRHIDGPFRYILAAARRITTKVTDFFSVLKMRLRFSYIFFINFKLLNYVWIRKTN